MQQASSPSLQPPGRLHQRDAGRNFPLFSVLERNSHKGDGVAVCGLGEQEAWKAEFQLPEKELRPTAGSWRKTSITRQHMAPKPKATAITKMDYLSASWKKMAQAVGEQKLLEAGVTLGGFHLGLPRWKQKGFWGRMGAYCFFTADSASPALPSIRAFEPFTSKGNWRNHLTSFSPRCWQIPKTDFVTQRLCLQ